MSRWRTRIESYPINLHWAGWETNTLRLQREGWAISVSESPVDNRMDIALEHPGGVRGYGRASFDYYRYFEDKSFDPWENRELQGYVVRMDLANRVSFQTMGVPDFNFHAIDANPRPMDFQLHDLRDLAHFRQLPKATSSNDIVVPEPTIEELLDQLLKKQGSKQAEIRARMLKDRENIRRQVVKEDVGLIIRAA